METGRTDDVAKRNKTSETRAQRAAAAADTPWLSTPEPSKPPIDDTRRTTTTSAAPVTSSGPAAVASPWTDTFEYAPWVGGSVSSGPTQTSVAAAAATRARIHAQQIRANLEQPVSYQNPWEDSAASPTGPLSRRDAIRARAAAKKRASIQAEADTLAASFDEDEFDEDEIAAGADHPAAAPRKKKTKKKKAAKAGKPAPSSAVWALGPQEIPVENLPMGVVNIIGDGVGAVFETGKSAGRSLSSAVKTTMETAPAVASAGMVGVAGAGLVFGYANGITMAWKIV